MLQKVTCLTALHWWTNPAPKHPQNGIRCYHGVEDTPLKESRTSETRGASNASLSVPHGRTLSVRACYMSKREIEDDSVADICNIRF